MRSFAGLVASLLVIGQAADVSAKSIKSQLIHALHHRAPSYEDTMLNQAHDLFNALETREKEDSSNSISTTPVPNGAIDLEKWDPQTKAACDTAMVNLASKPDNPSGLAVCYNIPFFNNRTGVFEAELRMYNMSAPFDPWTGVSAADISMTLSYKDATVQAANNTNQKRDFDATLAWPPIKVRDVEVAEDNALVARADSPSGPQAIKVLMYVGQVNQNKLDSTQTSTEMQDLLVPTVELSARSPQDNKPLSTTISANKASFLNGAFSQKSSDTTSASDASISNFANAVSFSIPGYRLPPLEVPGIRIPMNLIFPTGMIITVVWTVLFAAVVAYGTIGRIRFRDQYRRRVKVSESAYQSRI